MSRVQVADDHGRQLRSVWLGPAGSWRWPVDWTFPEWRVGFYTSIVSTLTLPLFVPLGLLAGALAYGYARKFSKMISEDHVTAWRRGLFAACVVLLAALSPSWRTWVLPMPFLMAIASAPILAILVIRRYGKYINWNRPFSWWVRLPGAVAAGPRLLDVEEVSVERLRFEVNPLDPATGEVEW